MSTLEQDVQEFVEAKIAKGEKFTAFNVTQELGAARHRYVKPIVHAMFENGEMTGYTREVDYSIDGEYGHPFVYSPEVVKAQPVTLGKTRITSIGTSVGTFATLNENGTRIRVHKADVENAGFKPGDTVYAITAEDKIIIVANKPATALPIFEVEVDVRSNIRLRLDRIGVTGNCFPVETIKHLIVVTAK